MFLVNYSWLYFMYQVYKLEMNASVTFSSLSLGPTRNVKCYNGHFINGHVFHTEEYRHGRKTYNNEVCVKGFTSNEFEVDYYRKLEDVIKLQCHSKHNIIFFIQILLV